MGSPQPADEASSGQIVVAVVRCDGCSREYYSAVAPRAATPLPPCPQCHGEQRIVDLIVSE